MQTFEKIAHAQMPFTSGGQTITDRINAARHSLAGSQLGKTICKATTEELMAPKKKHLDYLLHCTNEPNVSIPSMANLLIERTQNPNWVVVYKSLITIHNLMCYGNERFSQYLASCNTTFNLTNFVDKSSFTNGAIAAGYDMSTHVRRYGKYISEKIHTYRLCAFDFCKVKRGRDDGMLRTLHTDKLLKTMPILQSQIDALLEFQVTSSELNNGVINCSFILLFRDLIRLFACYNDGVINLLEKYFDMNKKQCREALDLYKAFLARLDRVSAFLSIAESVGIERGEVPDLTRAPASLLEALESHLYHLEGGRGPPPTASAQQIVTQQIYSARQHPLYQPESNIDEEAKQRYLEEEKERLRQYEEERRRQIQHQGGGGVGNAIPNINPFGPMASNSNHPSTNPADLLLFDTPPRGQNVANNSKQQHEPDPSNPFAIVAEINNRSQQVQMQSQTANPFLSGGGPMMPPQSVNAPFQSHPPNAMANPFGQNPQASNPYGVNGYGGIASSIPPYYPSVPVGQQQYWPPQTNTNTPLNAPSSTVYSQTPFSAADGSYSTPSALQLNMDQHAPQRPPPPHGQMFVPQWPTATNNGGNTNQGQKKHSGDMDSAMSNMVGNLPIGGQQNAMAMGQYSSGGNPFGAPAYASASTNPF